MVIMTVPVHENNAFTHLKTIGQKTRLECEQRKWGMRKASKWRTRQLDAEMVHKEEIRPFHHDQKKTQPRSGDMIH